MKYLKSKTKLVAIFQVLLSVVVIFLIFIKYDLIITLILSILSYVLIVVYDLLLAKKLENDRLSFSKENIYDLNRIPNLNLELVFSILLYAFVIIADFSPFVSIVWYLIPWAIIKYISKRLIIANDKKCFIVLDKNRIVKYIENEIYYEFSEIFAIKVKDDRILINNGLMSLPIFLEIDKNEKERIKQFINDNAKSIHAKY